LSHDRFASPPQGKRGGVPQKLVTDQIKVLPIHVVNAVITWTTPLLSPDPGERRKFSLALNVDHSNMWQGASSVNLNSPQSPIDPGGFG